MGEDLGAAQMKRRVSDDNPFVPSGVNRISWAFGYEFIRDGMCVLDYGCNTAGFIKALSSRKRVDAYGVEKNADIVTELNLPNVRHVDDVIPFEDQTFDVVTMFDVLEHIYDQKRILREVNRVLKDDGQIIVTVPRQYAFSFLDSGNFKYRFPAAHKLFYSLRHSPQEYDYRYKNNPYGLIGDVELQKAWHQHFRRVRAEGPDRGGGARSDRDRRIGPLRRCNDLPRILRLGIPVQQEAT